MSLSTEKLAQGDVEQAVSLAEQAWRTARAQRSNLLLSEAWLFLLDCIADAGEPATTERFVEQVEGAFYWAETMPDEIQTWLFPRLVPHLAAANLPRLADRAQARAGSAVRWLAMGNMNVVDRVDAIHVADVADGDAINKRLRAFERQAALAADKFWDAEGELLLEAAAKWRKLGRKNRAAALERLVKEFRTRRT